jgi:hypothetical protein
MLVLPGNLFSQDTKEVKKPKRSPLLAVCFSSVFPGGGQLYTQQYLRAAGFAGGLGYLGYCYNREDKAAIGNPDQDDYNYHNDRRRTYKWWFIGVWAMSLADAYVDAHLFKFDEHSEPELSLQMAPGSIAICKKF